MAGGFVAKPERTCKSQSRLGRGKNMSHGGIPLKIWDTASTMHTLCVNPTGHAINGV